jgi:hypothetical protein
MGLIVAEHHKERFTQCLESRKRSRITDITEMPNFIGGGQSRR